MGNVPSEQPPSRRASSATPPRLRKTRSGRGQLGDAGAPIEPHDSCPPEETLLAAWQARQSNELLDVPQPLRSQPIEISRMEPAAEVDPKHSDLSPHPAGPNYLEANLAQPAAPHCPPKVARGAMDPGRYRQLMAGCKSDKERAEKARRLEAMRRAGVDLSIIPVC
eukprot:EG_transcript_5487